MSLGKAIFAEQITNKIDEAVHLGAARHRGPSSGVLASGRGALLLGLGFARTPELLDGGPQPLFKLGIGAHFGSFNRRT